MDLRIQSSAPGFWLAEPVTDKAAAWWKAEVEPFAKVQPLVTELGELEVQMLTANAQLVGLAVSIDGEPADNFAPSTSELHEDHR